MIYRLSVNIVEYLRKQNVLHDDTEIYEYSVRIVISEVIATTLIIIIGLYTHHIIKAVLYELIMSTSRSILGGYHCKTYISCILLYVFLFIINLIMSNIKLDISIIIFIEVIGMLLTIICNPVINENKPLSNNKKAKFKKLSVIYTVLIIALVNTLIFYYIKFYNFLIYIFITLQILTIGGKIHESKTKKQNLNNDFI